MRVRKEETETLLYLAGTSVYLIALAANYLLPDAANRLDQPKGVMNLLLASAFLGLLGYMVYGHILRRQPHMRVKTVMNVAFIFGSAMLVWLVAVGKFGYLNPHSFPSPNDIFQVYLSDFGFLVWQSSRDSLLRVALGYFLALIAGNLLGFYCGRSQRLFGAAYPVAKVTACIPPVVYLPYAIAVFPSLDSAIIFMIFIGAFWPIYINTMFGVYNVDPRYVEFARTLGADERRILRRVIIPAAMPLILAGSLIGLVLAFVLLTAGEMVGAHTGLGFYLMYHTDVGYFDKVVASMLLISFWVFFWITFAFDIVQARLLQWQRRIG